jgi:hypothetical protein
VRPRAAICGLGRSVVWPRSVAPGRAACRVLRGRSVRRVCVVVEGRRARRGGVCVLTFWREGVWLVRLFEDVVEQW